MIDTALHRLSVAAILAVGGVHLDLWLWHGYRSVHVIGPLFLLNAIGAALIAVLLAVGGGTLIELAGLGYAASSLAAFLVSVRYGLFGFMEAFNGTPQTISWAAEAIAIALLGSALVRSRLAHGHRPAVGT